MANTKKYVSLDKLTMYDEKIKKVISDADAVALQSAKDYADSLAGNYDAAGSAATAKSEAEAAAKSYTDGQISEVNGVVAGVKTTAEKGVSDAAKAQAAADKAQGEVDTLESYVGTIPTGATATNIVAYVQEKTAGIAAEGAMTELGNRVGVVEGKVATIEGDYLKGSDKTELEGKINAKADQTALDGVSAVANAAATQTALQGEIDRAKGEESRIEGLVTAEAERAAGVESGLTERLEEVEAFFKLAEGEKLDTALDTLVEIQTYITGEGAAADQMVLDIAANTKAIGEMDTAYKAADTEIKGRLDVLEAINHEAYVAADTALKNELNGEIAKKANTADVNASVQALQGVDAGFETRIAAIEGKFGGADGSVEDMIADAKQEAIDAAASDATTKANAAQAAAEKKATDLNTAMNTRVEALEAIDHDHSNKALLDTYTQTEANLADAVAKKHAHTNLEVLEGITSAKVAAWDAAEGNAKTYADGLNTAMNTRVAALETWHENFTEVSEEEINALFTVKA